MSEQVRFESPKGTRTITFFANLQKNLDALPSQTVAQVLLSLCGATQKIKAAAAASPSIIKDNFEDGIEGFTVSPICLEVEGDDELFTLSRETSDDRIGAVFTICQLVKILHRLGLVAGKLDLSNFAQTSGEDPDYMFRSLPYVTMPGGTAMYASGYSSLKASLKGAKATYEEDLYSLGMSVINIFDGLTRVIPKVQLGGEESMAKEHVLRALSENYYLSNGRTSLDVLEEGDEKLFSESEIESIKKSLGESIEPPVYMAALMYVLRGKGTTLKDKLKELGYNSKDIKKIVAKVSEGVETISGKLPAVGKKKEKDMLINVFKQGKSKIKPEVKEVKDLASKLVGDVGIKAKINAMVSVTNLSDSDDPPYAQPENYEAIAKGIIARTTAHIESKLPKDITVEQALYLLYGNLYRDLVSKPSKPITALNKARDVVNLILDMTVFEEEEEDEEEEDFEESEITEEEDEE